MDRIDFLNFIKGCNAYRTDKYISFFFKNISGIKLDIPKYEKLLFEDFDNIFISIVKDSKERLDNTRHIMQRNSRNCFFCFVDSDKWQDVVLRSKEKGIGEKELEKYAANQVHSYFKTKHIAWFVHSYVYIILVLAQPNGEISKDNFIVYYWNTNFVFKKFPGKSDIFGNTKYIKFVEHTNEELELAESKDKELIDCVRAFKFGEEEFDLFELTKEHFTDVCFEIDNGVEYSIIEGPARSGKTILAMLLMHKYKDCKLLLLNITFYRNLKLAFKTLNFEFPKDRIFHHDFSNHDGNWLDGKISLNFVSDFSFLIVDEAQRLGRVDGFTNRYGVYYPPFDPFLAIKNIPNHKHTIFLGDNLQRINGKRDEGFQTIKNYYLDKSFREHKFYQTIGIPKGMISNVMYLLGFSEAIPVNPGEYEIELLDSEDSFIEKFEKDLNRRKHYVSLALTYGSTYQFGKNPTVIQLPVAYKNSGFNYLFNEELSNKYYLTPYDIISREAESIYLFIPCFIDELDYSKSHDKDSDVVYRQLYTLMTRATASLNIYAESEELRNLIKDRIEIIKNADDYQENKNDYKYDVFIAYHGTNLETGTYENAKKICDELIKEGISVYLYGYSFDTDDEDVGFNETTRIIQQSKVLIVVLNDDAPVDEKGMLPRYNNKGEYNQLYQELKTFNDLINLGIRNHKNCFRFFYCGKKTDENDIYLFLNRFFLELSYGFDCYYDSCDDVIRWLLENKENE